MILLIDNYDSFVFNLQRYFVRLGQQVCVVRNDDPRLGAALSRAQQHRPNAFADWACQPSAVVISPGPKRPSDAGYCIEVVRTLSGKLPILGVCLGHQVIYEACGGVVVRAPVAVHGCASPMRLQTSRLFDGLPQGPASAETEFARYHSLIAQPESLPPQLRIIASSVDGHIMAVEHRQHATFGVQFHPESILSPGGYRVLHNFLRIAGLPVADSLPPADWTADPLAATRWPAAHGLPYQTTATGIADTVGPAATPGPAQQQAQQQAQPQSNQQSNQQSNPQAETKPPSDTGPFARLPTAGSF